MSAPVVRALREADEEALLRSILTVTRETAREATVETLSTVLATVTATPLPPRSKPIQRWRAQTLRYWLTALLDNPEAE